MSLIELIWLKKSLWASWYVYKIPKRVLQREKKSNKQTKKQNTTKIKGYSVFLVFTLDREKNRRNIGSNNRKLTGPSPYASSFLFDYSWGSERERRNWAKAFEISKPMPHDTCPSTRAHILVFPNCQATRVPTFKYMSCGEDSVLTSTFYFNCQS